MRRAIAATALLILSAVPHAEANDDPTLSYAERQLALAVAKVCVNEAGFDSPADCALIWQTAENRAQTAVGRLRWLRQHSSCVLDSTAEEAHRRPGNCRWTRNLSRSGQRPEGYPSSWTWRPRNWERVQRLAERLVAGVELRRPCPSAPFTWGGRRIDMEQAIERGLVPLGCTDPVTGEETENEGFALR